jgi:hypothetical protein
LAASEKKLSVTTTYPQKNVVFNKRKKFSIKIIEEQVYREEYMKVYKTKTEEEKTIGLRNRIGE